MRALLHSLVLLCLLVPAAAVRADQLRVENSWVRAGPPTARVMAGYMTLYNSASHEREIVRVTSPAFARVELHLSRIEDGMARMIPQETLRIPAHGSLELTPGGYHLMLFDPVVPLQPGDQVELSLHDAAGRVLDVRAPVRLPGGEDADPTHQHHD
ncbi:MAG TPA: copper chaperone PCu(A)C [Thiohalobacter sp.]|nr:copper chaperone PCu(A)C [Thiohalobacter sp.]